MSGPLLTRGGHAPPDLHQVNGRHRLTAPAQDGSSLDLALLSSRHVLRQAELCADALTTVSLGLDQLPDAPPTPKGNATPNGKNQAVDAMHQIEKAVQECTAELRQVITLLNEESRQRRLLERECMEVRIELARARFELADTRTEERQARHLALHDALTGLPNRALFEERLSYAIVHAERQALSFAVMSIDLDDFKAVNDLHGHQTGDELLKIVAARLARAVRAEDTVSRWGGDEFTYLLSEVNGEEQVRRTACKLFDALSTPCRVGALELTVRPSIGIALWSQAHDTSADTLLKQADSAMYWAKRNEAGYAFFNELPAPESEKQGSEPPQDAVAP